MKFPESLLIEYEPLQPEQFDTLRDIVISYFSLVALYYDVMTNNNGLIKLYRQQQLIFKEAK